MTKQEQIEKLLSKPFEVGDEVYARGLGSQDKNSFFNIATITEVLPNGFKINKDSAIYEAKDLKYWTGNIGSDFFPINKDRIANINFTLESILFSLGLYGGKDNKYETQKGIPIKSCNWNPFIIDHTGEKVYYQRPFVWSVEDNQNLIESIYQNVDCGKILVRLRSWQEAENMGEEASWKDIVDGKQRLNAMRGFINNEFADNYGNYWDDLSYMAQHKMLNHQLFSYSELPENSKDEDVVRQFLKLNFCGVPQSKEHIDFVKSINI